MIKLGTSEMAKAYVGSDEVSKIFLGSELVWEKQASVLPYDAEVEYLESSGSQYINLPLSASKNNYFEVDITFIPVYKDTNKYSIFSANPYLQFEAKYYSGTTSSGNITYDSTIGNSASNGGWCGTIGGLTHYILSTSGKTDNAGTFTSLSRPLTADITGFRIFGGYRNSNRYPIKIRKIKITSGTTVLYDLKAVRLGQVGYMYDKVSGQLFGNGGTGSFTLGPDVII